MASQLVAGERASLTNLLLVEEHVAMTTGAENDRTQGSRVLGSGPADQDGRIFDWLTKVVGLSQDSGLAFNTESRSCSISAIVLTDEQRSIARAACNDVEYLLDKMDHNKRVTIKRVRG